MNRCSAGNSRWTWPALWMALALIRGLLYAAVVPPWQAPDEPGHFEYAWHIARLGRLPAPGEILPEFEREQLGSLYAWHYGAFIGRPLPDRMPERISELPSSIFAQYSRTLPGGRFSLAYLWCPVSEGCVHITHLEPGHDLPSMPLPRRARQADGPGCGNRGGGDGGCRTPGSAPTSSAGTGHG